MNGQQQSLLLDAYGRPLSTGKNLRRPSGIDVYYQIPMYEVTAGWDTNKARAMSLAHDIGQFNLSARMFWAMLCDPFIVDGCEKRALALRQRRFDVVPGKGPGSGLLARKLAKRLDDVIPSHVMTELFFLSLIMGMGVTQPEWKYWYAEDALFYPRLNTWHPQLLYYIPYAIDRDKNPSPRDPGQLYSYVFGSEDEANDVPMVPVIPGTGQWGVFALLGSDKPHLFGKQRAIWRPWIRRLLDDVGWIRYNDVHGMPIRGIQVPMGYRETKEGKRFFRNVAGIGRDATLYMPQGSDGKTAFGLNLIEAKSKSWDAFRYSRQDGRLEIAIALASGAEAAELQGDNYKKAGERVQLRSDIKVADALSWEHFFNRQIAIPFATLNGYAEEAAPRIIMDVDTEINRGAQADAAKATSEAILKAIDAWEAMRSRAGVEVPFEDFLARLGIELPPNAVVSEVDPPEPETTNDSETEKQNALRARRSAGRRPLSLQPEIQLQRVYRFHRGIGSRPMETLREQLTQPRPEPGAGRLRAA